MPQLFKILSNDKDVPSFFNSHPILEQRIKYTKQTPNTNQKETIN